MSKRKPHGYWTYERCREMALECDTKSELLDKCNSVVTAIYKNKWFVLFEHMEEVNILTNHTYMECKAEALKYNKKSHLKNEYYSVYRKIHRNKWYELFEHMKGLKYEKDWSYDECKILSIKYEYKSVFKRDYAVAYNKIEKEKWYELFEHMKEYMVRPNGYWTYERCKEEALRYNNNADFKQYSSGAYNKINKMGWCELKGHIKIIGHKYKRLIYVYEFSDNYFYVGLTYNIVKRNHQHLIGDVKSKVNIHIKETGLNPILIKKTNYIDVVEAVKKEEEILNLYLKNGWLKLNAVKTGSLGGNFSMWDLESVREEVLSYNNFTDFYTNSRSAYNYIINNGLKDILFTHLKRKRKTVGFWNDKEKCRLESQKFKNRTELGRNNHTAYMYCKRNNWLDEFYPK